VADLKVEELVSFVSSQLQLSHVDPLQRSVENRSNSSATTLQPLEIILPASEKVTAEKVAQSRHTK
jgi:hypothetical protein